eukprot:507937-Karenia_brevis.AAC.1
MACGLDGKQCSYDSCYLCPGDSLPTIHGTIFPMVGNRAEAHVPIKGINNPCPATPSEPRISTACAPRAINVDGDLPCPVAE